MSKKKVKANDNWCGKILRVWSACKSHLLGKMLIAFAVLLLSGVLNSLFKGFYDSCGVVISNASVGFFKKFVDLYYVVSAKAELSDGANEAVWIVYCLLIVAMWSLRDVFKWIAVDKSHSFLQAAIDNGVRIDKASKNPEAITEEVHDINSLRKSNRKLQELCEKDVAKYTKQYWGMTCVVGFMTAVFVFGLSLTRFAYATLKDYRHSVTAIRPFITEQEYHMLNRQWVLMKSKADYQNILKMLADYAKRCNVLNERGKSHAGESDETGCVHESVK